MSAPTPGPHRKRSLEIRCRQSQPVASALSSRFERIGSGVRLPTTLVTAWSPNRICSLAIVSFMARLIGIPGI